MTALLASFSVEDAVKAVICFSTEHWSIPQEISVAAAIFEATDRADRRLAAFEVGHGVAADGAGHLAVGGFRL